MTARQCSGVPWDPVWPATAAAVPASRAADGGGGGPHTLPPPHTASAAGGQVVCHHAIGRGGGGGGGAAAATGGAGQTSALVAALVRRGAGWFRSRRPGSIPPHAGVRCSRASSMERRVPAEGDGAHRPRGVGALTASDSIRGQRFRGTFRASFGPKTGRPGRRAQWGTLRVARGART